MFYIVLNMLFGSGTRVLKKQVRIVIHVNNNWQSFNYDNK